VHLIDEQNTGHNLSLALLTPLSDLWTAQHTALIQVPALQHAANVEQ
jgi:hypothetical protein